MRVVTDTTANSVQRPLIGTNGDLGAGQGLFWFGDNPQGGNVLCGSEITSQISYNANPAYNVKDNTRQSTRIRIKGIRIFGRWHPNPLLLQRARCYVDIEPRIYIPHAGISFRAGEAISPINFICDHKGVSNTETQTVHPPEDFYLIPNVQKGKHAFTEYKSREGPVRFHQNQGLLQHQAYAEDSLDTGPPPGSTTNVPDHDTHIGPGWGATDDSRCVTWNIPLNVLVEYPRTSAQEIGGSADVALKPIFLAWTGKRSSTFDTGSLTPLRLGTWDMFSAFIFFEDITNENA